MGLDEQILALLPERDLRFYNDARITFSGDLSAGERMRNGLYSEPLLDHIRAEILARVIVEHILPTATDDDKEVILAALKACPRRPPVPSD